MDESLGRLAWALPLVLGFGVLAVWVLKRVLVLGGRLPAGAASLSLRQSLVLSEHSTAHLLVVEGRRFLVVEGHSALSTTELDAAPQRRWARAPHGGQGR